MPIDFLRAATIIENGIRNATENDIDYLANACATLLELPKLEELCAQVEIRQPSIATFSMARESMRDIASHPCQAVQSISLTAAAVLAEILHEADAVSAH